MNKFIKDFKTFVNETYTGTAGSIQNDVDSLPDEVKKTVEKILNDNFDDVTDIEYEGNTVKFKVTKADFEVDQPEELQADLVSGAEVKRQYDVSLKFVDGFLIKKFKFETKWWRKMASRKDMGGKKDEVIAKINDIWDKMTPEEKKAILDKEIGGELIYEIDFKLKTSTDESPVQDEEEKDVEVQDAWEKPEEEDELVSEPGEERKGRGRKKIHLSDIEPFFRSTGGDEE